MDEKYNYSLMKSNEALLYFSNTKVKTDLIVRLKDIDNLIQKLKLLKLMDNYD